MSANHRSFMLKTRALLLPADSAPRLDADLPQTSSLFCSRQCLIFAPQFFVAGGSKRGWTTWDLAAVDTRVAAIAPIVAPVLSTTPHTPMRQVQLISPARLADTLVVSLTCSADLQQNINHQYQACTHFCTHTFSTHAHSTEHTHTHLHARCAFSMLTCAQMAAGRSPSATTLTQA